MVACPKVGEHEEFSHVAAEEEVDVQIPPKLKLPEEDEIPLKIEDWDPTDDEVCPKANIGCYFGIELYCANANTHDHELHETL